MSIYNYGLSPTSVILRFKLLDSSLTNGGGKTGLAYNSSGLIIAIIKDSAAAPTVYTSAGSTIETITTLGTYAAPTSSKCRFKEIDSTNMPGWYEIQFADACFASCNFVGVAVSGVTNLAQGDYTIDCKNLSANTVQVDGAALSTHTSGMFPADQRNIDGAGLSTHASGMSPADVRDIAGSAVSTSSAQLGVNVVNVGGTAQTARDIGASVLLSSGTGTGQLDFTSGVVKANLAQILGTVLTETAGYIANAFKTFFNIETPTLTTASKNQTGDSYARLGAPSGASVSADILAIKTKTDQLIFTSESGTTNVNAHVKASDVSGGLSAQATRDAMKLAPTSGTPAAGSVDAILLDVQGQTDLLSFTGNDVNANIHEIDTSRNAAIKLAASADTMASGAVDTLNFTSTTMEFESSITTATASHWVDRSIAFKTGSLAGQVKLITAYSLVSGKGHFTCNAFAGTPANGDTFEII